jgi:hypothetical protein
MLIMFIKHVIEINAVIWKTDKMRIAENSAVMGWAYVCYKGFITPK